MTTGIRSNADGSKSYIAVGGTDVVTIGTQGIEAGSYKPGSIVANDFADGALIENAPVGIGYGVGAGGTVTQATSKSTAVTLNKPTGQITMNNASLATNTTVNFVLNNSLLSSSDVIVLNVIGGVSNVTNYNAWAGFNSAGAIQVYVRNISTGSLSEAVVLNFAIIKGATA